MDTRVENEVLKRTLMDIIELSEYLPPSINDFGHLEDIHNLVKYNTRPIKKMCIDALNFIEHDGI